MSNKNKEKLKKKEDEVTPDIDTSEIEDEIFEKEVNNDIETLESVKASLKSHDTGRREVDMAIEEAVKLIDKTIKLFAVIEKAIADHSKENKK